MLSGALQASGIVSNWRLIWIAARSRSSCTSMPMPICMSKSNVRAGVLWIAKQASLWPLLFSTLILHLCLTSICVILFCVPGRQQTSFDCFWLRMKMSGALLVAHTPRMTSDHELSKELGFALLDSLIAWFARYTHKVWRSRGVPSSIICSWSIAYPHSDITTSRCFSFAPTRPKGRYKSIVLLSVSDNMANKSWS